MSVLNRFAMRRHLLCFTQDLRLSDQRLLQAACKDADELLAVYIWPDQTTTSWGFPRLGAQREKFIWLQLHDLAQQLRQCGNDLLVLRGNPHEVLRALLHDYTIDAIFIEAQYASEEQAMQQQIASLGVPLHTLWQSGMYDHHYWQDLPKPKAGPCLIFTEFRRHIEAAGWQADTPLDAPSLLPPVPALATPLQSQSYHWPAASWPYAELRRMQSSADAWEFSRSDEFFCDRATATQRIADYFSAAHGHHYKQTRDQLFGAFSSSRWSPWLAQGVFSARQLLAQVRQAEQQMGANSSTYWLWFELLWRDYFRYVQAQLGARLFYRAGWREPRDVAQRPFDAAVFARWCHGQTGLDLVDAGMRELNHTGFCSNRMRQILASYWLNELQGDWRAGAAWFEAQLIDYDVYSNYGNWLYLAGLGTDPRGGRHFNIERQISQFDPERRYRDYWLRSELTRPTN